MVRVEAVRTEVADSRLEEMREVGVNDGLKVIVKNTVVGTDLEVVDAAMVQVIVEAVVRQMVHGAEVVLSVPVRVGRVQHYTNNIYKYLSK